MARTKRRTRDRKRAEQRAKSTQQGLTTTERSFLPSDAEVSAVVEDRPPKPISPRSLNASAKAREQAVLDLRAEAQDALQHKDFDRAARLFERSLQDVSDLVTLALPYRVSPNQNQANGAAPAPAAESQEASGDDAKASEEATKDASEQPTANGTAPNSDKESSTPAKESTSAVEPSDAEKEQEAATREALARRAAQSRFVIPEYIETTDSAPVVNARPQRAPDFSKIQYMLNRQPHLPELKMRYQLVTARLAGDNTENTLRKAVREITELLLFMPQENSLKSSLADAHTRLFEISAASRALLGALEDSPFIDADAFMDTLRINTRPELTCGVPYSLCKKCQPSSPADHLPMPLPNLPPHAHDQAADPSSPPESATSDSSPSQTSQTPSSSADASEESEKTPSQSPDDAAEKADDEAQLQRDLAALREQADAVVAAQAKEEMIVREFEPEVPLAKLREYFMALPRTKRKEIFSLSLKDIHEAIDLGALDSVQGLKCERCRMLVHDALDQNAQSNKDLSLFLLRQELACRVAYKLWHALDKLHYAARGQREAALAARAKAAAEKAASADAEEPVKKETGEVGEESDPSPSSPVSEKTKASANGEEAAADSDGVTVRPGVASTDGKEAAADEATALTRSDELEPGEIDPNDKPAEEDAAVPYSIFEAPDAFLVRDGVDFIGATGMDSIEHISQCFQLQHFSHPDPKLSVNLKYVTGLGFDLMSLLAPLKTSASERVLTHVCETHCCSKGDIDTSKEPSLDDFMQNDSVRWRRFLASRMKAHLLLEVKAQEQLTQNASLSSADVPKEASLFEGKLKDLLGEKTQLELTGKEIELSIPVLLDYAKLMNRISGIPTKILLLELFDKESADEHKIDVKSLLAGLPDESPNKRRKRCDVGKDEKCETCERFFEAHDMKVSDDYEPVGLAVVIHSHEYYVPSDDYDRDVLTRDLKEVEKSVIRMQLQYRAQVKAAAGDKYSELESVMSNLQTRGLELTQWLRGFVHFLMDRLVVENDIIEQSGSEYYPHAMLWFDQMQSRVAFSQSMLLSVISRCFLRKLEDAFKKSDGATSFEDLLRSSPPVSPRQPNAPLFDATQPLCVANFSSPRFEKSIKPLLAQPISIFISTIYETMQKEKFAVQVQSPEKIAEYLANIFASNDTLKQSRDALAKDMRVDGLAVAYISIHIPHVHIANFNNWSTNPDKVKILSNHDEYGAGITELVATFERWKCLEEVICFFVYSSVDRQLVAFPNFTGAGTSWPSSLAAMYPLCSACEKDFGVSVCGKCEVQRYCGDICQSEHSATHAKKCKVWSQFLDQHQVYRL